MTLFAQLGGFAAGERIAFRLPNGAEWISWFLALQRAGLAAIPLDAATPDDACIETARRLGASAVYFDDRLHVVDSSPRKKTAAETRVACIKVTSGTGALPKGVECRAEHLIADGTNVTRTMGIRPGDRNLAAIPFGHSYGLGNLVMPLILQGTSVICAREFLPRQLLDWAARHEATVFPAVPALFRVLASLPSAAGNFPRLRRAISAAAVLSPEVAKAFHARYGVKIHNFYGSSETGGICYDRTGAASLSGRSVGKPLDGVSVTVKAGRITVKSAAVATRIGRWTLGDQGEWNGRAELVLVGRGGQGANIGGKKVHPLEIERALRALPGVNDAVVWLWQRDGRDLLAAGVETAHSQAQVERALAAQLPAWKLPRAYFVARDLPRSARGKIDLAVLRRQIEK